MEVHAPAPFRENAIAASAHREPVSKHHNCRRLLSELPKRAMQSGLFVPERSHTKRLIVAANLSSSPDLLRNAPLQLAIDIRRWTLQLELVWGRKPMR